MSCSFKQGLCGYEQEQELDDLDWLWHDGKGDDDAFLPVETHWHFYYAYLNTSAPQVSSLKEWVLFSQGGGAEYGFGCCWTVVLLLFLVVYLVLLLFFFLFRVFVLLMELR